MVFTLSRQPLSPSQAPKHPENRKELVRELKVGVDVQEVCHGAGAGVVKSLGKETVEASVSSNESKGRSVRS